MSSSPQPINLLFQALSLDCSVLEALLKKHRNSHGRTIYYRRMKMVLQAIQKWQPMSLESDFDVLNEKIQRLQPKKKKDKSRDEEWSIYVEKSKETNPTDDAQQSWKEIVQTIEEGFPEVISRILHASEALMTEIQRGFFLPFCTVALAALARISCLHKRIGNWAISELQNLETAQSNLLQLPKEFMQRTTEVFMLRSSDDNQEQSFDNEALLASMGIASNKLCAIDDARTQDDGKTDETAIISQPVELDNDDVGESLLSITPTSAEANLDKGTKPKKLPPASSVVDQNLAMLEKFKEGDRGSQGKKKKSKKRKESSPSEGAAEIDGKKKKKKKKKNKNKGKDFFDNLFD